MSASSSRSSSRSMCGRSRRTFHSRAPLRPSGRSKSSSGYGRPSSRGAPPCEGHHANQPGGRPWVLEWGAPTIFAVMAGAATSVLEWEFVAISGMASGVVSRWGST